MYNEFLKLEKIETRGDQWISYYKLLKKYFRHYKAGRREKHKSEINEYNKVTAVCHEYKDIFEFQSNQKITDS